MTPQDMESRIVRYGELQPCKTAFIDAHTPGSNQKENFTIIGGGVSESPDQHVHISIQHGFNIGAAGQPPRVRNSLHDHSTAEVFFVLSGRWRFFWGRWGTAGEVTLEPGDIFNIPTGVFRGFENIGTASRQEGTGGAYVPVSVVNEAAEGEQSPAERLQNAVVDRGVASASGGARCRYDMEADALEENSDSCLLLVVDGEVVNAFGMDDGLAQSMARGSWADSGNFRLTTTSFSDAQTISINLRAGALPAELDISGQGTSSTISATQGENFRLYSAITGVFAVFAVAGMVFVRYREPRVALPMILTALAEVYALLGFAALVGYPLELAVIAGFIAVVGTGVDDLVIIADEVMSEGEVNSRTVFDSRFRRAFWVIGAAAATTIVAMSPLMVLSLGDLSGFAIFTILGVLIGVLITRPAYGDILRRLLTVR